MFVIWLPLMMSTLLSSIYLTRDEGIHIICSNEWNTTQYLRNISERLVLKDASEKVKVPKAWYSTHISAWKLCPTYLSMPSARENQEESLGDLHMILWRDALNLLNISRCHGDRDVALDMLTNDDCVRECTDCKPDTTIKYIPIDLTKCNVEHVYNNIVDSNSMINTRSRCKSRHGRLVRGCLKSRFLRSIPATSLLFSLVFLRDEERKEKLKSVMSRFFHAPSISSLIRTAIKGQLLIKDKGKHGFEDTTPLWRRFSTFMPTPPVFYTVYPATSFLPGVGSSGRDAMTHLGCRLASLAALPDSCNVSRSRLAQAGFYYDISKTSKNGSNSHEVVCFSCGVTWSSWEASDNPMVIHRRLRPDCDYIKSQGPDVFPQSTSQRSFSSGPSSLSSLSTLSTDSSFSSLSSASSLTSWSSTSTDSLQASSGFGVGGSSDQGDLATDCAAIAPAPLPPGHVPYSSQSGTYSNLLSKTPRLQSGASARNTLAYFEDQDDRTQLCMDSAVYPQFSTMSERLATFQGWPLGQYFKPDDLVYDGFYYAGYADCLRCFYCGVGLKSWERNDSVMDEHIRWRPTCGYILAVKGRRFVNMTLQRITAARPDEDNQTRINAGSTGSDVARNGASNQVLATARSTSTIGSATVPANTNGSAAQMTTLSTNSEAIQRAKEIGFSDELIARATRDLVQQSDGWINTAVFIEYLTDLTTVPNNDTTQSSVNGDLHTDGAHCSEGDTRSQRAQEVMQENERLRSMRRCKICNKGTVGVIFMPCGHLLACTDCAGRTRNCSRCGQYIRATANVYLS